MNKLITFSINTDDSEFVYTSLEAVEEHLINAFEEFRKDAARWVPEYRPITFNAEIKAECKYTQEELDNLPER